MLTNGGKIYVNHPYHYPNIDCLLLTGPTCSYKSSFAIKIAQALDFSIVNFDSLLFYKELNIGTAKPSPEELNKVPHYLVNVSTISSPLNAMDFNQLIHTTLSQLNESPTKIILVGGSAFYLKAFLNGMYEGNPVSDATKEKSQKLFELEGIDPFLHILKTQDPERYSQLHPNDHYRVRRAVEYFWENNQPFSHAKDSFLPLQPDKLFKKFSHLHFDIPKSEHWQMIEKRCIEMIHAGLIEEVQSLLEQGFSPDLKPLQSIGYKETIDFLENKISIEELQERIFINTRRLAKSQRTFFNQFKDKDIFNPITEEDKIKRLVEEKYTNE
jgi:tRNA dimethylallyltransferase